MYLDLHTYMWCVWHEIIHKADDEMIQESKLKTVDNYFEKENQNLIGWEGIYVREERGDVVEGKSWLIGFT